MSESAPLRSSTPARRVRPGRPTRVEAKRREAALLEIATALIVRHGYRALSLESIAREAHVAARTIYAKFGGKSGLLAAVVEHGDGLLERAPDLVHDPRPARAALVAFARNYLWAATRPAALALRRTIIAEAPSFPAVARSFFERGPARVHAQLAAYFRRADVRRELGTRLSATTLAAACQSAMLCGEYRRLVFGLRSSPTRREIAAWATNAITFFLDGARAARPVASP